MNYCGFKIRTGTNPRHPELVVAERFGVEVCANSIEAIKVVIENHIKDVQKGYQIV